MSTAVVAKKPAAKKVATKKISAFLVTYKEKEITVDELSRMNLSDVYITFDGYSEKPTEKLNWYTGTRIIPFSFGGKLLRLKKFSSTKASYLDGYFISCAKGPDVWMSGDWKVKIRKLTKEEMQPCEDDLKNWKGIIHRDTGCDPEIFITDKNEGLIPAFSFLDSKKNNPNYYWDGYQAEFAPSAGTCLDGLRGRIFSSLANIGRKAKKVGGHLSLQNTFYIDPQQLKNEKFEYVRFGCSPSFNAYGEDSPIEGVDPFSVPIRSAGGHLHFTLPSELKSKDKIIKVVKDLDAILGVISVSLFQKWDDPRRRLYYGRAGEYRTPSYGVEYRVLSNAWLIHPIAYNFVFEIARRAMGLTFVDKTKFFWKTTEKEVRECINNCDVRLAHKILNKNKNSLRVLLRSLTDYLSKDETQKSNRIETMIDLIYRGFHSQFSSEDVLENWLSKDQQICYFDFTAKTKTIVKKAA
jgi:hypothetical protein